MSARRPAVDRTSPEYRAAVRRAVESAPPIDDATRVRLRAILGQPARPTERAERAA